MTKVNLRRLMFLMAVTLVTATVLSSCNKDDEEDDTTLPPIGGYNNADEVGSADLVAYFPLNGDGKESKSGVTPENTQGVTYVTAMKGQGAKFTSGFMAYPQITALGTTMESMSISLWAKAYNNGGTDGHPSMFFSLTRENEWAGNINLMAETGWRTAASDTLVMKGLVVIKNGDGSANWQDIINAANPSPEDIANGHVAAPNTNGGKWAHYVITWEATTGLFKLYANGQKISNPVWESRGGGNALPLNFFTPTRVVLGAFEPNVTGTPDAWQQPLNGEMDEIRVWKKTLSAADINALYELEKAGR
ncbi:MAG: hypothetical protein JXR34_03785 [Bacteroidales bacterium]|nr:hypothetical protein [Bacteroidales bacterium]